MALIELDDTPTEILPRVSAPNLAPDQTGGLELFIDMLNLRTKKDATTEYAMVATEPEDEKDSDAPDTTGDTTAQPVLEPAQSHAPGRLAQVYARLKARISKAVATVREATQWLFSEMPNPQLITRCRNRFFGYKGRHNVRVAWYGRQRSTSAAVVITRERRQRAQQTSQTKEGVLSSYFPLPEYWVSHMADLIQTIRDEHSVFHPSKGRHWECS